MKHLLIISTALVCSVGIAQAGPCTDRISQLERNLTKSDAGSGPTNSTMSAPTPSQAGTPKAGEVPGTGGTASMNATVGNKAASASDVRAQQSGGSTAAQGGASNTQAVSDAMARAKTADAAGDGQACGKALDEADRLMKS